MSYSCSKFKLEHHKASQNFKMKKDENRYINKRKYPE